MLLASGAAAAAFVTVSLQRSADGGELVTVPDVHTMRRRGEFTKFYLPTVGCFVSKGIITIRRMQFNLFQAVANILNYNKY